VKIKIYKIITSPFVLYGCASWFFVLRGEHRLRLRINTLNLNKVLRRIFGLKRDEVMGGWRKTHNEELHNLYFSPNIITMIKSQEMKRAGHLA
jgi:hypothetical protein